MEIITSRIVPQSLEVKMKLPRGKILSFWVSHREEVPQLFVSIQHDTKADMVDYMFYIILEPQAMKSTDSLGDYYGSFDVSPEHQNRIVHVFKQLYKDEKPQDNTDTANQYPVHPSDAWPGSN